MTLSVYHDGIVDWVIAESPEDAHDVCMEHYDCGEDELDDGGAFLKMDDDETLTISDDGKETTETHTAAEWVLKYGRGFLCSTEY